MKSIKTMLRRKSINRLNEAKPDKENVLFSTGLGINEKPEIPVRLIAYLLPILTLVSEYPKTRGQIYLADKAALRIGQDPEIVQENCQLMRKYINLFINTYLPSVRDSISISNERDDSSDVVERRVALVNELVDILLNSQDRAIFTFASNRRKEDQDIRVSLGYMAEHTLFMRDAVTEDDDLFLIENPVDYQQDTLAMIGGPAEEIFYKVRKRILRTLESKKELPNGFKRIQLFSDIGRIPPYYARFGEPTIEKGLPCKTAKELLEILNPQLRKDYLVLLISLSEEQDFSIISRRNNLTDEDYFSIQSGFSKLNYFLTKFKDEQESLLARR